MKVTKSTSSQFKYLAACTLLAAGFAVSAQAALIDQTVNDGGVGWNGALWGSPAAAPVATNDYRTATGLMGSSSTQIGPSVTGRIRGLGSQPTFAGNSLEIIGETEFLIKDAATYTADITLSGGVIRLAPNSSLDATLGGTLDVTADSYLGAARSTETPCNFTVNSTVTGTHTLYVRGGDGSSNSVVFSGDLSGFTGNLDVGGGEFLVTVDFNQDYDLPNVDVVMGTHATADKLLLDQNLKFASFTFGVHSLQTGILYTATNLNAMFGDGTQFVDGGGTLSVYYALPQLLSQSPAAGAAVVDPDDFPLDLGAVILDGSSSAVDTNSVSLFLDATNLTLNPGDVVKNATTTTVSHAVSTLPLGPHTLSLVYSATGTNTGPFTNEWSFIVTQSDVILQTVNDTGAGWNGALWGSPAAAPVATNDYRTATGLMSSSSTELGPSVTGRIRGLSSGTNFAGNSLEIIGETEFLIKDAATYTADITLSGGVIRLAPNSPLDATLAGTLDVTADAYLGAVTAGGSANFTVNSTVTGTNVLFVRGGNGPDNSVIFGGDLSGFAGSLDVGGGEFLVTVDFNQDYDLPNVDVVMGTYATADKLRLDQNLKFSSFSFGAYSLQTGVVYTATDLNGLFGDGTQFVDGSGTLSVYTHIPSAIPQLLSKSPAAGTTVTDPDDFPLNLGGVILDGSASSVDTNTVSLFLDSNPVALGMGDVVKNATTTTVSHAVSTLPLGSHTLSLVYSATGAEPGPFTNEWSFEVFKAGTLTVLVSGTSQANDQAIIDLFLNYFENAFPVYGDYSDYGANAAEIEAADLFVVGRSLSSSAYANSGNSASFNALNIPVVAFTSYVTRTNDGRWGWHVGDATATNSVAGDETTVTAAGAAVFGTAAGTYDWYPGTNDLNAAGTVVIPDGIGEGTVLATIGGGGDLVAVHWPAGGFFGDGFSFFGNGERLLFNLQQSGGVTVLPAGESLLALINALDAYTPLTAGVIEPIQPEILTFSPSSGTATLSWDSQPLVDYHVESTTTNGVAGPWQTNLTVSGTGTIIVTNVAVGSFDEEYFRLEAQPQ